MHQVNMHEAKTRLSQLVEELESGIANQIIIARNGKPVARLVGIRHIADTSVRIGVARGEFVAPDPSRELDEKVAALFAREKPS